MNKRITSTAGLAGILFFTSLTAQTSNDPVLLTVGDSKITKSQFESVYKKNSGKDQTSDSKKSVESYLDLYVNFRLKVKEAEELKMDTTGTFKTELAGYRRQLAQPKLADKDVNEQIIKEAYDRLQFDIKASHILIRTDEQAVPRDSADAYTRIMLIRDAVMGKNVASGLATYEKNIKSYITGNKKISRADSAAAVKKLNDFKSAIKAIETAPAKEKFATAASSLSEDPSAKENKGDLGYFTAMQMVYPFETKAYVTAVGEISTPVRTKFGYHILNVIEKRKAQGEILVAHIMVKTPKGMSKEDSIAAYKKAEEIYGKLKNGEDFAELAKNFSDDKPSARKGGELQWFGTNRMPTDFEAASFALQKNGDFSMPVKTMYGWHIIKRLDKKEPASFDAMKAELKGKVSRDSRAQASKTAFIEKVKKEYKFTETKKKKGFIKKKITFPALEEMYAAVDTNLFEGKWMAEKAKTMNKVLFTLLDKNYNQGDFAKYIESHQSRINKSELSFVVNNFYKQWVDESVIAFKESRLDAEDAEFRNLMQEYRDGILLFELMDKRVWSKAVKDSVGLKEFYEKNKNNYLWDERAEASVYTCADEKVAGKVREMLKAGKQEKDILTAINKDSQLNLQIENKVFQKKDNELVDANWNPGISSNKVVDKKVQFVQVHKLLKPTPKAFNEAKGIVTSDYQNELEKQWIESLKAKYKIEVNKEVLSTIK